MEKELVLERYSDIAYIDGVYRCDSKMERAMHKLCRKYYDDNFHKQEVGEEGRKDIFQSSLLALWENIRNRRLYVEDGELKGRDGQAFTSSLTTYFMGIVNNKYMEWLRKNPIVPAIDPKKEKVPDDYNEEEVVRDFLYDDATITKLSIISNRISHMAKRCNMILTLFYYEEKDYDEMLVIMPTFKSKDALKTAKYKCLKRLRDSVNGTYC